MAFCNFDGGGAWDPNEALLLKKSWDEDSLGIIFRSIIPICYLVSEVNDYLIWLMINKMIKNNLVKENINVNVNKTYDWCSNLFLITLRFCIFGKLDISNFVDQPTDFYWIGPLDGVLF